MFAQYTILVLLAVVALLYLVELTYSRLLAVQAQALRITENEMNLLVLSSYNLSLNVPGLDQADYCVGFNYYHFHYEPGITRPSPEPNADTAKFLRLIEERVKELRPSRITILRLKSLCYIYEHFSGKRQ
jgi:hypothetical protein